MSARPRGYSAFAAHNIELAKLGRTERLEAKMRRGKISVTLVNMLPVDVAVDVDSFMRSARRGAAT